MKIRSRRTLAAAVVAAALALLPACELLSPPKPCEDLVVIREALDRLADAIAREELSDLQRETHLELARETRKLAEKTSRDCGCED